MRLGTEVRVWGGGKVAGLGGVRESMIECRRSLQLRVCVCLMVTVLLVRPGKSNLEKELDVVSQITAAAV